jgi:hypothetical protein
MKPSPNFKKPTPNYKKPTPSQLLFTVVSLFKIYVLKNVMIQASRYLGHTPIGFCTEESYISSVSVIFQDDG